MKTRTVHFVVEVDIDDNAPDSPDDAAAEIQDAISLEAVLPAWVYTVNSVQATDGGPTRFSTVAVRWPADV